MIFPGALSPGIFLHHHLTGLIGHVQFICCSLVNLSFILNFITARLARFMIPADSHYFSDAACMSL